VPHCQAHGWFVTFFCSYIFVQKLLHIDVVRKDVCYYDLIILFIGWRIVMGDRPFTATLVRPRCISCGAEMWLSRVGPHPTHSTTYDVCTFECKPCGEAKSSTLDHWTKTEIQSPRLAPN